MVDIHYQIQNKLNDLLVPVLAPVTALLLIVFGLFRHSASDKFWVDDDFGDGLFFSGELIAFSCLIDVI